MRREEQIEAAIAQLRSYGAVGVLGAGLSAPRYPMTGQLPALLWHAIDSNPAARASLAQKAGRPDAPAKKLLGGDYDTLLEAWRIIETNPSVRMVFQRAFVQLDLDREPTPAHYALARLIHAGIVEYTISFNWDSALERAHEQLFGTTLSGKPDLLAKPHGDAFRPERDWVLPHQPGVVPAGVRFDWNSNARSYIRQQGSRIDFGEVVTAYHRKVEDFYKWLFEDLEDLYRVELEEYRRLENEYDCILLGLKLRDYFEGDNARMFTLSQEIFGDVLPAEAISEIESEVRGPARADRALQVLRAYRNPPTDLEERIRQAFLEEDELYSRRDQEALWVSMQCEDEE